MSSPPGNRFTYDNGNSHLLSAVLTEATGMSTAEYARRKLFRPLGIDEGGLWPADPQGITRGAVGLQLRPRDFAKLGELYLRGGRWNGRQIVPADYVRESTTMQVRLAPRPGHGYGYHWRVADALGGQANRPFSFAALGYAGQSIAVVPSHDLVVVTTAQGDPDWNPADLVLRFIVPAVSASPRR
jgi:CubicO group peptidase (beta-lactamase class C family)